MNDRHQFPPAPDTPTQSKASSHVQGQPVQPNKASLIKILSVEDNPMDAAIIRIHLTKLADIGEIRQITRLNEALMTLKDYAPDIILLDLNLPDNSGLSSIIRIRQQAWHIPILVLTGTQDEQLGLQCLDMGAQDYLSKDELKGSTLKRSIRHAISRRKRDVRLRQMAEKLEKANARLKELVTRDPLTHLLNRRGLQETVATLRRDPFDVGTPHIAALIDCDNFKGINTKFGHAVGDSVLRAVATRLHSALRDTDFVARIGGDEFLAILPETHVSQAYSVAERIRMAISTQELTQGEHSFSLTVSIGVVALPNSISSLEEAISLAKANLERSKTNGKNQVTGDSKDPLAPGGLCTPPTDLLECINHLRTFRQCIVDTRTQLPIGFELLVRGPDGLLASPIDLFRLASEKNALTLLDLACIRSSVESIKTCDLVGQIHINILPSTLIDTPPDELQRLLGPALNHNKVCIEVSEQHLFGDPTGLLSSIKCLKDASFIIALDDVGFGRSCLENLIVLEPDIMKIDQSLVRGVSKDGRKLRAVKRLLTIADSLGVQSIAKGLENNADLDSLLSLDVTLAQGYLWGHPEAVTTGS